MKLSDIQVLIKNIMHEARIKCVFLLKSKCPVLSFEILHLQIFIQQNTLGAMKVLWKWWKMLVMAANFFFFFLNAGGEKLKSTEHYYYYKRLYVHILNLFCPCLTGDHRKTKLLLLLLSWKAWMLHCWATSSQRTLTLPWTRRRTCWSRTWPSPWSFLKGWRRPRSSMAGEGFVGCVLCRAGHVNCWSGWDADNLVKMLQFLMFNEKRCQSNLAL